MVPWASKQTCCDSLQEKYKKGQFIIDVLFILLHYNIPFCRKKAVKYLFETQADCVGLHNETDVLYFLGV